MRPDRGALTLHYAGSALTARHAISPIAISPKAAADSRNMLRELGTGKGDRVFALAGRIPELYTSALGTLKNTSVSAFGPEPIFQRLHRGDAKVLVTTAQLYKDERRSSTGAA
jgi:acetyl-CoA synthetase